MEVTDKGLDFQGWQTGAIHCPTNKPRCAHLHEPVLSTLCPFHHLPDLPRSDVRPSSNTPSRGRFAAGPEIHGKQCVCFYQSIAQRLAQLTVRNASSTSPPAAGSPSSDVLGTVSKSSSWCGPRAKCASHAHQSKLWHCLDAVSAKVNRTSANI